MQRFLSFFLLLLLYCTIATLALTEHHRCIFHSIPQNLGSPPKPGTAGAAASAASPPPPEPAQDTSKPPPRSKPDGNWAPIRIKFLANEVDFGGRYCSSIHTTVNNYFDNDVACTEEDVLSEEKKKILVEEILPEAIKLHTDRLLVEPLKTPIVMPSFTYKSLCDKYTVPQEHKTTGISDADMLLYVGAVPTPTGTFAWAATCATLSSNGRPVIGIINYGPRYIVATPQRVRVAAHEIAHALGFSVEEMVTKQMVRQGISVRGKSNISFVVSQNTRRESIGHYNCENVQGMELEDENPYAMIRPGSQASERSRRPRGHQTVLGGPRQGRRNRQILPSSAAQEASVREEYDQPEVQGNIPSADFDHHMNLTESFNYNRPLPRSPYRLGAHTANADGGSSRSTFVEKLKSSYSNIPSFSHWKRRNAKDELMVGFVGAGYYTALTLGAFADLGYYRVNWAMAEQMSWGNKAGCEFLNDKCVKEGSTKFPDMFCTTESTDGTDSLQCTSDRQSMGRCGIQTYERDLEGQFQYFSDAMTGGERASQMDYCPFITAESGFSCTDGDQSQMPGSLIAANSRCVQGENLIADDTAVGAVCVEVSCKFKVVSVRYSGNIEWHSCYEGETLTVNGGALQGKIVCPKYADVCNTLNRKVDESQGPRTRAAIMGVRGNDGNTDGSVTAAIFAPLLFIFLAVSTIMAP